MSSPHIGVREYGKQLKRERWYHCAVMGEVVPESETMIPSSPHAFMGLRVCFKHLDPLSYDEMAQISPPRSHPDEFGA